MVSPAASLFDLDSKFSLGMTGERIDMISAMIDNGIHTYRPDQRTKEIVQMFAITALRTA
jgi:hypothetical protein